VAKEDLVTDISALFLHVPPPARLIEGNRNPMNVKLAKVKINFRKTFLLF
jgi:hypothetical protein